MRIGLIAPPWIPVPPVGYGGTEEVVDGLARGLQARGHDVVLFTVGESTCPVRRRWHFERAVTPMGSGLPEAAHVLSAYAALSDREVIHDHTSLGPLLGARGVGPGVVVVTTSHGPFTPAARLLYAAVPDRVALVAISEHHRATAPDLAATVILHGIDLDLFLPGPGDGDYLLFVGRMSPDKGPDRAIRIARAAGMPLFLAAKARDPEEQAFFHAAVEPLLGPDVALLGEATVAERVELLRHATAVVNPICWPEPFGLVMAEALACGTPVVGCPRGAAPEIVVDGVTGFLRDTEAGLVAAVGDLTRIDRRACRARAEERFSLARMAADYEALFAGLLAGASPARVLAGRRLGTPAPALRGLRSHPRLHDGHGVAELDIPRPPAAGAGEDGAGTGRRGPQPVLTTDRALVGSLEDPLQVEQDRLAAAARRRWPPARLGRGAGAPGGGGPRPRVVRCHAIHVTSGGRGRTRGEGTR